MSQYKSSSGRGRNDDSKKNVHLGWDKLVKKLEGKGYSKEYAEKIAGKVNKEKYGK